MKLPTFLVSSLANTSTSFFQRNGADLDDPPSWRALDGALHRFVIAPGVQRSTEVLASDITEHYCGRISKNVSCSPVGTPVLNLE